MSDVDQILDQYAKGDATWRELAHLTGLAYGEVLIELAKRGLAPPRVTPERRPAQDALFERSLGGGHR